MATKNILIIEDDIDLLKNIVEYLELEEYAVTGVSTVKAAFTELSQSQYDIAVVDIGLPDRTGYDVVQHLRTNTSLGIIIVTAKDAINDKMRGYDAGADYYFVKPVNSRELSASIKSLLCRLHNQNLHTDEPIQADEWLLNFRSWTLVSPKKITITLTPKEMSFLQILAENNNEPVSREIILENLNYHQEGPYGNRALDVLIVRLRKKIKTITKLDTIPIKTIHSMGFTFTEMVRMIN